MSIFLESRAVTDSVQIANQIKQFEQFGRNAAENLQCKGHNSRQTQVSHNEAQRASGSYISA